MHLLDYRKHVKFELGNNNVFEENLSKIIWLLDRLFIVGLCLAVSIQVCLENISQGSCLDYQPSLPASNRGNTYSITGDSDRILE